jgi:uncharacterized protein YbjT (DUF2867 family)
MNVQAVAVYGATGHTGGFVLRELERRGYPTVSIGRNAAAPSNDGARGAHRRWRRASCDDPDALDAALAPHLEIIRAEGQAV